MCLLSVPTRPAILLGPYLNIDRVCWGQQTYLTCYPFSGSDISWFRRIFSPGNSSLLCAYTNSSLIRIRKHHITIVGFDLPAVL
jgi:hypothetical protein